MSPELARQADIGDGAGEVTLTATKLPAGTPTTCASKYPAGSADAATASATRLPPTSAPLVQVVALYTCSVIGMLAAPSMRPIRRAPVPPVATARIRLGAARYGNALTLTASSALPYLLFLPLSDVNDSSVEADAAVTVRSTVIQPMSDLLDLPVKVKFSVVAPHFNAIEAGVPPRSGCAEYLKLRVYDRPGSVATIWEMAPGLSPSRSIDCAPSAGAQKSRI